jgi:hypothetical protein
MAYLREVRKGVWRCQYSLPKVADKYKRATVTLTGTRAEVEGELARIERMAKIEQPKQSGETKDGTAPRAAIPITPRREPPCYVLFGDYAAIDRELL